MLLCSKKHNPKRKPDSDDEVKTGPTGLSELTPPTVTLSAIYELSKHGISKETAVIAIMKKLKVSKSVAKGYYSKALYNKVKNIQNKDAKVKPNSKHAITNKQKQKIMPLKN